MRQILLILICAALTLTTEARSQIRLSHHALKEMERAERYIPGFFKDSVKACYPVYRVLTKKEYRNLKFKVVPRYDQIEEYLDFNHATLEEVIAMTSKCSYILDGKYSNKNAYCYSKSKDDTLASFIDSIKPDRVYFLFGQYYLLLIDKSGEKYLVRYVDSKWQKCDLPGLIKDISEFNIILFPYKEKKKLVYTK